MDTTLIYLDTCSIQRPLDNKLQPRIFLEAEAILTRLSLVEAGELGLLSSDVLKFEISCIANINRRTEAEILLLLKKLKLLNFSGHMQFVSPLELVMEVTA